MFSTKYTEDLELLRLMKRGDNSCFDLLYRKYKGKIYNFILNISGGDTFLAEDIVQSVFVKLWENKEKIKLEGSFSALLFTMSKNMFCNQIRQRAQQYAYNTHLQENHNVLENNLEQEIEFKLLEAEIDKLIAKLPPARREVYMLSKKSNFSNKDIAKHLNISEKTVESHLLTATKFIRKSLAVKLGLQASVFILMMI